VHRSKSDIRQFLAARFGFVQRTEFVQVLPEGSMNSLHAPAHVRATTPAADCSAEAPSQLGSKDDKPNAEPTSPSQKQYLVQFALNEIAHARLRYAQALLSHALPKDELAEVFERALEVLIPVLEKQKFGGHRRSRGETAVRR